MVFPLNDIRSLPENWWKTAAAAQTFSFYLKPYLVQLSISYLLKGKTYRQPCTGLLIDVDGSLLWLTAGHVIDAIEDLRTDRTIRLLDLRWLDDFPNREVQTLPVSDHNFRAVSMYSSHEDFGAIFVPILDSTNLRNNPNIKPMIVRTGQPEIQDKPEGFVLVGFPWEQAKIVERPETSTKSRVILTSDIACLPLERIDPPDPPIREEFWDDPSAFYARIVDYTDHPGTQPEDIRGMSGGAIFSFSRFAQGLHITLEAIHSSYKKRERHIRGEPIDRVLAALDALDAAH